MRLLIVDDSALMRRMLSECFAGEPDIVIERARDGENALEKLHSFDPDVITLDINMPKMDGLTCLAHIMEERPKPVVMVSSLSEKGAIATFEALELGAVDYVTKPDGTVSLSLDLVYEELRSKVRAAAIVKQRPPRGRTVPAAGPDRKPARASARPSDKAQETDLVLIGSSTGGPRTLETILTALPAAFPAPILIAQHMPPRFTRFYAQRLNEVCALEVCELTGNTPLRPGTAYIAPGAQDVEVIHQFRRLVASPVAPHPDHIWHPSVSRMVATALEVVAPERLVGVMLTGMGDDGSTEMAQLQAAGGRTIAESHETAAIWGMPQQLIEKSADTLVLRNDRVAEHLVRWVAASTRQGSAACR